LANVAVMRNDEKLAEAIRRSVPLLPAVLRDQVLALLEPASIAIMTSTTLLWAGSHLVGVGEIVDVALLIVGLGLLGTTALSGAKELGTFAVGVAQARTDVDLDQAAAHFAQAVSILGISLVSALLLRESASAVVRRGLPRVRPMIEVGAAPGQGAPLRITRPRSLPSGAAGETDWWGNIAVIRSQSFAEQRATLYHEWVHRILSPRVGPLRQLRARLRASGYWRSALLRYLEEAMAESYGQLRAYGFGSVLKGISFPISGGYVTLSELGAEGVAIGNILVGGTVFQVVVSDGPWAPGATQ
jgi:hypothetical protein